MARCLIWPAARWHRRPLRARCRWSCSPVCCGRIRASMCCSRRGAASMGPSCGSPACRAWTPRRCVRRHRPALWLGCRRAPDARAVPLPAGRESRSMRTALEVIFWTAAGLIVWTQLGYALLLALLARLLSRMRRRRRPAGSGPPAEPRALSLIIAAHDERDVIADKVENALALDYPRERLEVIVACDGCGDDTAVRARQAGADIVLELARGGKIRAQDAAVQQARGEIVAFSDANAAWEPQAARELVGAFADPRVGYACGQVRFSRT